jgi:hypothetical protein
VRGQRFFVGGPIKRWFADSEGNLWVVDDTALWLHRLL